MLDSTSKMIQCRIHPGLPCSSQIFGYIFASSSSSSIVQLSIGKEGYHCNVAKFRVSEHDR